MGNFDNKNNAKTTKKKKELNNENVGIEVILNWRENNLSNRKLMREKLKNFLCIF